MPQSSHTLSWWSNCCGDILPPCGLGTPCKWKQPAFVCLAIIIKVRNSDALWVVCLTDRGSLRAEVTGVISSSGVTVPFHPGPSLVLIPASIHSVCFSSDDPVLFHLWACCVCSIISKAANTNAKVQRQEKVHDKCLMCRGNILMKLFVFRIYSQFNPPERWWRIWCICYCCSALWSWKLQVHA